MKILLTDSQQWRLRQVTISCGFLEILKSTITFTQGQLPREERTDSDSNESQCLLTAFCVSGSVGSMSYKLFYLNYVLLLFPFH